MATNDFLRLLGVLTSAGVDFIVVGGTAAVLHGSSMATYDLDVLMPFTPENCERLLRALDGLHPRLSHTADRRPLAVSADELIGFRNLYLLTDLGRLDVLGSLPPLHDTAAVMDAAQKLDVGGIEVRVLSLPHLLEVKAALGRPKDRMMEVELRALADAKRNSKPS